MNIHYLYKLTFPNDKVYIGQTVNFKKRMNGHKNDSSNQNRLNRNCQVNNAIRKYGWDNIKKEILLTCNELEIDEKEREYIKLFNSIDRGFGYNRESGGNLKKIVSPESKKLISNSRSGKAQWGKQVLQIDLTTDNIIKVWESICVASRELGIPQSNISNMCNNKQKICYQKGKKYFSTPKSVGGFKWSFLKVLTIA